MSPLAPLTVPLPVMIEPSDSFTVTLKVVGASGDCDTVAVPDCHAHLAAATSTQATSYTVVVVMAVLAEVAAPVCGARK